MTPRVLIIIPAYNALRFLPQTVASALAQTWDDFELLIVDDGSSDGTEDWVSQQRDSRIRMVQKTNGGLAAARNTGIATARGEYVAFLDADDLWEPNKLEQQVACLDAHPEVGLVHTAIRYIDEDNHEINRVLGIHGDGDVWREVVVHNPVRCGSTPLVRRECFEVVGIFDPTLTFSEDWDMWIRIASSYHFATINEPLTLYRQHNTNMTKGYQVIMPNLEKIIERAFQEAPAGSAALKQESYGRAYLFAAWRAFFAHDFRTAKMLQRQAFAAWPRLRFEKNNLSLTRRLIEVRLSGLTRSPRTG